MLTAAYLLLLAVLVLAFVAARDKRFLTAGTCAAAVFAARVSLVATGYIYGATWVRALDALAGVSFLLLGHSLRGQLSSQAQGESGVAALGSLLALPVAAVAVAQLLAPVAPQTSGITTCSGAPVAGSKLRARTGEFGLNSRSGPGTTYSPEGRFDSDCVVGVDGYCVGEPVNDKVVPLPDVRWLRLRHSQRYVSAGTLFSLGPEAALGSAPESGCPEARKDPALTTIPKIVRLDKDTIRIEARPERTELVGFSMFYEGTSPERIEQLGSTPKLMDDTTGLVTAQLKLPATRAAEQRVEYVDLAVVPCLAPVIPTHQGDRVFRIDLKTGRSEPLLSDEPKAQIARLRLAACRIDPSASNEAIEAAAKKK